MKELLNIRHEKPLKFTLQQPTVNTSKCRGEKAAASGCDNAAVAQPEDDDISEAAINAFANLSPATAVDHGIVATYRLTKQLEGNDQALKEIRTLLTKERNDRGAHKPSWPSIGNYYWTRS
jgi:hypothetical protein